jgi:hypothetical protein
MGLSRPPLPTTPGYARVRSMLPDRAGSGALTGTRGVVAEGEPRQTRSSASRVTLACTRSVPRGAERIGGSHVLQTHWYPEAAAPKQVLDVCSLLVAAVGDQDFGRVRAISARAVCIHVD